MQNVISLNGKFKSILVISDLHCPVEHPDAFAFLKKIKEKIKPNLVISIGDAIDLNTLSRYDLDPNFISPHTEIVLAGDKLRKLSKIFPKMYTVLGNHDLRLTDRAFKAGIPDSCLKSLKSIFRLEDLTNWHFCNKLRVNWSNEKDRILFVHHLYTDVLKGVALEGTNLCSGHQHTKAEVKYLATSHYLRWGCVTGCLCDQKATCFQYAKGIPKKFIMATAVIQNNVPKIVPMLLKDNGRWNGKVYL